MIRLISKYKHISIMISIALFCIAIIMFIVNKAIVNISIWWIIGLIILAVINLALLLISQSIKED